MGKKILGVASWVVAVAFIVALVIGIGAGYLVAPPKVIEKEVPVYINKTVEVPVEKIVYVNRTVEVPVYVNVTRYASLMELAEAIRNGEIDVGEDYTMALGGRFHKIHNEVLGLQCQNCHAYTEYPDDYLYARQYEVPERGAPGAVDRNVCIACHRPNSVAHEFFDLP